MRRGRGDAAHTFTIADQQADRTVQPGQQAEVTVTFPESGTVLFRCTFHANVGMLGALTVKSGPVTASPGGGGGY